jgi:hypothetical protein
VVQVRKQLLEVGRVVSPIGDYITELRSNLCVGWNAKRRIVQEIKAHLLDAAHHEEQLGIDREEAERRAVDRLGSAEMLAARFPRASRKRLVAGAAVGAVLVAEATTALVLAVGGNPRHSALALSVMRSTSPHSVAARGSTSQSVLTPRSSSITAYGSSTSTLTVTARDALGNNLTSGGSTVTFTSQSGTGTIGSITANGDGTYTATVTGSGSGTSYSATVTGSGR